MKPLVRSGALSRALVAVIMATVFNHLGDRLLGVTIEIFTGGISYFSPQWVADVFLVPFFAGILTSAIYGFGGKWLCYLPPVIVRIISYYEVAKITGVPEGMHLIPLGWWGFFLILVAESASIGGILGEVVIKRTYGRRPRHLVYKNSSRPRDSGGQPKP